MLGIARKHLIAVAVKSGRGYLQPMTRNTGLSSQKPLSSPEMQNLIAQKGYITSVPESLRILSVVEGGNFHDDKPMILQAVKRMMNSVLSKNADNFGAKYLSRFIDHCSNLGIVDGKAIDDSIARYNTFRNSTPREDRAKCALSIWSACLWNGIDSRRVSEIVLKDILESIMSSPDAPDWHLISRLSWCILNDATTKHDPAITGRMTDYIKNKLGTLDLKQIAELVRNNISKENTVVRKLALQRIIGQVGQADFDPSQLSTDPRIPISLLRAWTEERIVPNDLKVFDLVVNRSTKSVTCPDLIADSLATLNYPELNSTWDPMTIKRMVINSTWIPDLNQISNLCGSFAILGIADLESVSFLANHLHQAIIEKNSRYKICDDLWKIGMWYSFLQTNASQWTLAAIHDAYKELTVFIASGMWENNGAFVRYQDVKKLPPNERSIRTVVSGSLNSLGITNLKNRHIVNTPFTAHLFLPDRDVAILFVRQGEDILSDGRFVGSVKLAQDMIESRGINVKVFRVEEYEKAFNELRNDDFMDMLLSDIQ
jgi:hypothetical protein